MRFILNLKVKLLKNGSNQPHMPQLSRFFGIIITMYYDDHNPPHFHAIYGEFSAQISISDLAIIEGSVPSRVLGLIVEWASLHRNELYANWERMISNEPLLSIEPLQ